MFISQTSRRNIWRNKTKNTLAVVIGALIVLFFNLYIGNIHSGQLQIGELARTLTVRADIANASGSQTTALKISYDTVRFLQNSGHVKDLRYTVALIGGLGEFAPEDWEDNLNVEFTAVNDFSAVSGLTADTIEFLEGMDGELLRGDSPLCLIYEDLARLHGLSLGDRATFTLYYFEYPSSYSNEIMITPLGAFELTVAGVIWPTVWNTGTDAQTVILPAEWLRGAYAASGAAFSPASVSFSVADPQQLNAFKAEMQAFGLKETDSTAPPSYTGNALKVNDKVFLDAVSLLEENQRQLRFFLPFVLVILVCTGYLSSYLLTRSRRREYAVMRSLGTGGRTCFAVFLLENAALVLCGAALGSLLSALCMANADAAVLLIAAGAYSVCCLVGTVLALLGFGRFSVMAALTQTD